MTLNTYIKNFSLGHLVLLCLILCSVIRIKNGFYVYENFPSDLILILVNVHGCEATTTLNTLVVVV